MNTATKLLILLSMLSIACSNDDPTGPNPAPSVLGDWQVVAAVVEDGAGAKKAAGPLDRILESGQSHVRIEEDQIWVINQRGLGFRRQLISAYERQDDQLRIGELSYSMDLGREKMILEGPSSRFELRRDDDIPDPERWIEMFEPLATIKTTNNSTGDLAWDGEDLWVSGGPQGKPIYRQDSGTLTAFLCEFASATPTAIEHLGGFLWGNDGTSDAVHLFDHANETVSSPIFNAGRMIRFLAGEGSFLWCGSARDRQLRVYDASEDEIVLEMGYGDGVELAGASIHDGRLYIAASGNIAIFDIGTFEGKPASLVARGAIGLPGYSIHGVAHDGTMLWVNAQKDGTTDMWLHRIQPPVGGGG